MRFRRHAVLAVIASWAAIALVITPAATADLSQFETTAAAEGVRIGVLAPGASLFDQLADVGIPVAQSVLTGLGVSQSFASLPYPGDVAISGPATVTALLGVPAPPPYPLYASSSHPSIPETKVSQPGYELRAAAGARLSEASAVAGGSTGDSGVATTKAIASTRRDGDRLIGEATSTAEVINAGGVLHVGRVFARAKTTRDTSGKLRRESDFAASGISVAGVALGLSAAGLSLAGSDAPLPDESPINQILEQSGISIAYLKPMANATGIVSGGLVITQRQVVNGSNVTISYVFGRARSHASGVGDATTATGDSGAGGVLADVGAGSSGDAAPGSGPAPAGATSAGGASNSGLSGTPTAVDPSARRVRRSAASRAPLDSRSSTYVVILVAALAGLAGSQLLRILGVKLRWRS